MTPEIKPTIPCQGRTSRRDALPIQSALAIYAKILWCAAGRFVGCMAHGGQQSGKSNSQWAHGLRAEEYLQTRKLISELTRASDGSF
jgi:hypothetical protein